MYDLHCHLLPDVDDGPATWEETFTLARHLVGEGVTTVAATPHSYGIRRNRPYDPAYVKQMVAQAQTKFSEQKIPLTVVVGTEILLGENTLERLKAGQVLGYGGSRTILLETSAYIEPKQLEQAVDNLYGADYRIVLAHPEKIEAVHNDPNVLIPLVERGITMQITAANLAGLNGTRKQYLCEELILHGMGHLIASDAHTAKGPRAPAMQVGYQAAKRLVGSRAYHLFVTIPRLILNEKPLPNFRAKQITERKV
jgi:protein-tyrosine phosphatase